MAEISATEPVIEIERQGRVAIVRLNRPKALNALNEAVMNAMTAAIPLLDQDPEVGAIIITG